MPLKSIYLLPHGGVIIPGLEPDRDDTEERKAKADRLLMKMEEIGQEFKEDNIDIIFLTSPHGYLHPNAVQVAFNSIFEAWQYYHKDGRVEQMLFPGHSQLAQIFFELLLQKQINTQPLIFADTSFPLKIAWGEAIPLQFLSSAEEGPQVVLFSLPLSAGTNGETDVLDKVADTFLELCDAPLLDDFNVSLVVSGDLSHKHDANHEYGYSKNADLFDEKSVAWMKAPDRQKYDELLELHETAASCGIFGMGVIQRLMEHLEPRGWTNHGVTYALPTYFGMSVASWKGNGKIQENNE